MNRNDLLRNLGLSVFLLFHASAPAEQPAATRIIVSDIDDTLKRSHIVSDKHFVDTAESIANPRGAFIGGPQLYQKAVHSGADIYYLSAAPAAGRPLAELFLGNNDFPRREQLITRKSLSVGAEDHKANHLNELLQAHPDKQFVLVGDDGERDRWSYQRTQNKFGKRIDGVFIHSLYNKPLEKGETAITAPQYAYLTNADLALGFYALKLISLDQLKQVVEQVHDGLYSKEKKQQDLAYPIFGDLRTQDVKSLFHQFPWPEDADLQKDLSEIIEKLEKRKQEQLQPSGFIHWTRHLWNSIEQGIHSEGAKP